MTKEARHLSVLEFNVTEHNKKKSHHQQQLMLYYTVSFHSYILSNILIRSAEDSTMSFNSTGRINALVVTIDHAGFSRSISK